MKLPASRLLAAIVWLAAATAFGQSSHRTLQYTFHVIRQFPHDPTAFTQGFAYQGGYFYEGTGLNGLGQSALVMETKRFVN